MPGGHQEAPQPDDTGPAAGHVVFNLWTLVMIEGLTGGRSSAIGEPTLAAKRRFW